MSGPIRNLIRNIRNNRQERRERRRAGGPAFFSLGAGTSRLEAQVASRIAARYPQQRRMQANPDGPDTGRFSGNRPDGVVFKTETTKGGPKPETIATPAPKQAVRALPVSQVPDPDRTSGMAGPQPVNSGNNTLPEPPATPSPREDLGRQRQEARDRLTAVRDSLVQAGDTAALQSAAVIDSNLLQEIADAEAAMQEAAAPDPAASGVRGLEQMASQVAQGQGTWAGLDRAAMGTLAVQTDAGVELPGPMVARQLAQPYVDAFAINVLDQNQWKMSAIPLELRNNMLRGLKYAYPISEKARKDPRQFATEVSSIASQLNSTMNPGKDPQKTAYLAALAEIIALQQKTAIQMPGGQ